MQRNIVVESLPQAMVEQREVEIVERKGIGHPDSVSDGFFPFADSVELIRESGITNVAAPLGSIRDSEVLEHAQKSGMNFIGIRERAFRH